MAVASSAATTTAIASRGASVASRGLSRAATSIEATQAALLAANNAATHGAHASGSFTCLQWSSTIRSQSQRASPFSSSSFFSGGLSRDLLLSSHPSGAATRLASTFSAHASSSDSSASASPIGSASAPRSAVAGATPAVRQGAVLPTSEYTLDESSESSSSDSESDGSGSRALEALYQARAKSGSSAGSGVGREFPRGLTSDSEAEVFDSEDEGSSDEEGEVVLVDVSDTDVDRDELAIESLGLATILEQSLLKRGIARLFPIQHAVLAPSMEGRDIIARAKTGTGKTLAFGIPILERITREIEENNGRRPFRAPRCLVLAPTRELAKQVEREFCESAPNLSTACVYGGVSIEAQMRQLKRGVDVVVGTPGRLIDLIERGTLSLREIQFMVLDEADQMLAVGFEEDVERIMENLPEGGRIQMSLFSATMPSWVKKLSRKEIQFMVLDEADQMLAVGFEEDEEDEGDEGEDEEERVRRVGEQEEKLAEGILLLCVGEQEEKLAEGIRLLCVRAPNASKRSILVDLITVHAMGGKTIVFTQTKKDADEVAMALGRSVGCEALHGDIPQQQRERTLQAFRDGRFVVLVATDVAARGLDIPNVDLVIHYEIPNDPETFVHRSGRTGRAGKTGCTILMYTDSQVCDANRCDYGLRSLRMIERDIGCKFEKASPPHPDDVLQASANQSAALINRVHPELAESFLETAEKLLEERGPIALAAAIAHLSGFSQPPAAPVAADARGGVEGAVFDLPEDVAKELLSLKIDNGDVFDIPRQLPTLVGDDVRGGGRDRDNYGRGRDRDNYSCPRWWMMMCEEAGTGTITGGSEPGEGTGGGAEATGTLAEGTGTGEEEEATVTGVSGAMTAAGERGLAAGVTWVTGAVAAAAGSVEIATDSPPGIAARLAEGWSTAAISPLMRGRVRTVMDTTPHPPWSARAAHPAGRMVAGVREEGFQGFASCASNLGTGRQTVLWWLAGRDAGALVTEF
ncbi:unnamed protein product [Closterium sp. NIES-64]|nr:unnamed protein product [Closterium sp. NIES-64]